MGIAAMLGSPIKRREDPRLITGQATYVDDIKLYGMLHMAVLRSPYGHARITSINTDAARKYPGVVAVYTAADLKGVVGSVACAVPVGHIAEGMGIRQPLAEDKVRFYGDPVAVVIAEDRYGARDARDLIDVDYEPLPVAIDVEKAMQPDAPLLYEQFGTNVAFSMHPSTEEIDKVFEQTKADGGVVVKGRFINQRLSPVSIETRGVVADYNKGSRNLTLWSSSQIPHILRNILAATVGHPQHQVRVIVPEVGGGFGSKLNVYPEELVTAYASMKLGRPVKWIEDRSEALAATIHGRDQVNYFEISASRDGKVTGLKIYVISDMGSYSQLFTDVMVLAFMFPVVCGAYDIPVLYRSTDLVFTNKASTDAYRGAGRPEATYLIERAMDMVARELGKDPVEIRKLNFIKPDQFPYKSATGNVYDSGNYEAALAKAQALADYQNMRAEQARLRAEGKPQRLKEKMKQIASHMLEASASDVTLEDGKFFVAGSPQKAVTFTEVAATANLSNTLHPGIEPGLETTAFWEPAALTYPFGTHICMVEVDKDTGEAEIKRYIAVDDCGRQLNPLLVEGQIHGGIAQGIGQAMIEGVEYTEDGQLLTATLMDYAMPLASELPSFETDSTVTPSPVNPLGVKGIGEAGAIGSTPAVANAIADALGVAHVDMPFTSEKLWKIIHQK